MKHNSIQLNLHVEELLTGTKKETYNMSSKKENVLNVVWKDHCILSGVSDAPIRDALAPNSLPVTNCSLQNP